MIDGIENKLDNLGVLAGDLIFLHTSFSRISHLADNPEDLILRIIKYLGKRGTLVIPRYTWNICPNQRPWKGYELFIKSTPPLDLKNTPANIGVIPEIFRKMDNVVCSKSYFWSVSATGHMAKDIVEMQEKIIHPYGKGSSFKLLHENGVKILGLGVTLNTNSLCPIVDYELNGEHARRVFTEKPVKGTLIDFDGSQIETESFTLRPKIVKTIKPSALFKAGLAELSEISIIEENSSIYFCYPYKIYHDFALKTGRECLNKNKPVHWLKELKESQNDE